MSTVPDPPGPDAAGVAWVRWPVAPDVAGYAWPAPAERGVVLLQHGYGDHTTSYVERSNRLIPRLLELGLSVHGFDLPGSGHSAGVRGATDVRRSVELHRRARALLADRPGPLFVVGHSLGGLVTVGSVLADQRGVAGMVLLAPAIKYDVHPAVRALARLGARLVPTWRGPMPAGPTEALTRLPDLARQIEADPLMYRDRVRWVTLGGGATESHAHWSRYAELRVPLLAVHGTADASTDPTGSSDLVALAGSADATLHLVPEGRHAPLDDTDRESTTRVVLDWLDQRAPNRPAR